MLQFLRNMSSSWIMKIILGILVLSFGLFWGISDVFRSRNYDEIVAVVGGIDISKKALEDAVQNQIKAMNAELKGKAISLKQFDQLIGINKVLDRMIDNVLLDQFAKDAGINTPNLVITNMLLNQPEFKDAQGKFDRQKFTSLLQSNALDEATFINNIQRSHNRVQLMSALLAGTAAPAIEALKIFEYFTSQRTFTLLDNLSINISYSEQALKDYFEANKAQFTLPEQRKIFLVSLDPQDMARKFSFTPLQVKEAYGENLDSYMQPEKRTVTIAGAKTQEAAAELAKKLHSKQPLSKETAIMLENVAEQEVPVALRGLIFGAKKGHAAEPALLNGQYVVIYVHSITPSQTLSLAKAHDQIVADLRRQKALDEISKKTEAIEALLNKGLTIVEVAQQLKLATSRATIDSQGRVTEGFLNHATPEILKDALSFAEGEETPITESADDLSYVLKVEKIMPARVPSFEESKPKVMAAWQAYEKKRVAKTLYEAVQVKAQAAGSLKKVSSGTRTMGPLSLSHYDPKKYNLSQPLLKAIFAAQQGDIVLVDMGSGYALVQIDAVAKMPVEKNIGLYKVFKESLAGSLNQALAGQFLQALRAKYKVEIHQNVVKSLGN
ncbi:MAG: SurA N-terminal domain-containing protein [Alphaproteobacteria bacterium]